MKPVSARLRFFTPEDSNPGFIKLERYEYRIAGFFYSASLSVVRTRRENNFELSALVDARLPLGKKWQREITASVISDGAIGRQEEIDPQSRTLISWFRQGRELQCRDSQHDASEPVQSVAHDDAVLSVVSLIFAAVDHVRQQIELTETLKNAAGLFVAGRRVYRAQLGKIQREGHWFLSWNEAAEMSSNGTKELELHWDPTKNTFGTVALTLAPFGRFEAKLTAYERN